MVQSTDSNLLLIPDFWSNYSVEPPTQKTNLIEQFHLAIIAKKNLDIDNLKKPLDGSFRLSIPITEGAQDSENVRITEEKQKLDWMRRNEADKKSDPSPLVGPMSQRGRLFPQNFTRVKVLSMSFKEFFDLLGAAVVNSANKTFERYKLLSRKQKNRDFFEQFWGALSDLARACEIGIIAEQEWMRDLIKFNMRNCDLQRRILLETLNPVNALNQVIFDEKGYYNHPKLTNMTRANKNSSRKYVQKFYFFKKGTKSEYRKTKQFHPLTKLDFEGIIIDYFQYSKSITVGVLKKKISIFLGHKNP